LGKKKEKKLKALVDIHAPPNSYQEKKSIACKALNENKTTTADRMQDCTPTMRKVRVS